MPAIARATSGNGWCALQLGMAYRSGRVPPMKRLKRGGMPVVTTNHFGPVEYEAESVLEFPRGLPGFEDRRGFLPLRQPENDPLIFLQSLEDPALCFTTAPVRAL